MTNPPSFQVTGERQAITLHLVTSGVSYVIAKTDHALVCEYVCNKSPHFGWCKRVSLRA